MGEGSESFLPLRLLKLAVLLSLVGVTIWQGIRNIQEYFKYESVTSVSKEDADSIEFPLVTICNYNRWKYSLLPEYAYEMAVEAYAKANGGSSSQTNAPAGTPIDIYNFTYDYGWQLIDAQNAAQFGVNRQITLWLCNFAGQDCNTKFFRHRMTSYGNCYTFNQDLTQETLNGSGIDTSTIELPLKQTHASESNGLELYINVEAYDYAEIPQTSGNPLVGLKVIIHSKDEEPDPTVSGVSVGPGFYSTIAITRTEYSSLSVPWGSCNPDAKTTYFSTYTTSGCEIECKMKLVYNNCSCQPYYFPITKNICNLDDTLGCAAKVIDMINSNFSKYCTCPEPCSYEKYSPTITYAPFPSTKFGSVLMAMTGIPSIDYMKTNLVGVKIYFSDMGSTIITQSAAHTAMSTLNDLGGTTGLYVGFSFMTIVELVTVIADLINERLKHRKNAVHSAPPSSASIRKEAFQ